MTQESVEKLPNGSYKFTVSRKLDTGNSKNLKVTPGQPINVIWARNATPDISKHPTRNDRGMTQILASPLLDEMELFYQPERFGLIILL